MRRSGYSSIIEISFLLGLPRRFQKKKRPKGRFERFTEVFSYSRNLKERRTFTPFLLVTNWQSSQKSTLVDNFQKVSRTTTSRGD